MVYGATVSRFPLIDLSALGHLWIISVHMMVLCKNYAYFSCLCICVCTVWIFLNIIPINGGFVPVFKLNTFCLSDMYLCCIS